MKILPWIVIALLTIPTPAQESPSDAIVAIVNNEVITYGEVYAQIKDSFQKIEASPNRSSAQILSEKQEIFRLGLQRLVDQKLTLQEARRYNIKVADETVREQLQKEMAEHQGKPAGMGELDFTEIIRHRLTLRELFQKKTGYSREEKRRAAIDPYVSPQEIRYYYQKHIHQFTDKSKIKIRYITIYYERSGGREKAFNIARSIFEALREKADFAQMARDYSQDPYARHGGTPLVSQLLFSVPADFAGDLENDVVKERLRQKFRENTHELSPQVKIQADPYNRKWVVDDHGKGAKYTIRQEQGTLQISKEDVWDFIEKENLHKEVAEIAFTMNAGKVSDPIPVDHPPEGDGFWQIVKVEEVNSGGAREFAEVQEDIRELLRYQKIVAAFERMTVQLRRDAFIWPSNLFDE